VKTHLLRHSFRYGVGIFAFAWIAAFMVPLVSQSSKSDTQFGLIPVMDGGRIKPWDSLAKELLLFIHGKQTVCEGRDRISSSRWISMMLFNPELANSVRVFRIDHQDLKSLLGPNETDSRYFSYESIRPHLATIDTQARLCNPDPKERNNFEKAIIQLHSRLIRYQKIQDTLHPHFPSDKQQSDWDIAARNFLASDYSKPFKWPESIQQGKTSLSESIAFIPSDIPDGHWEDLLSFISRRNEDPAQNEILQHYLSIANDRKTEPLKTVHSLKSIQLQVCNLIGPKLAQHVWVEFWFNQTQPFVICIGFYLFAFLLVMLGWIRISPQVLKTAFYLLIGAFILHTLAITVRMWIMGRPPVTNLYSSAVFVGWGTVATGLILEKLFKSGIGSCVAATTGVLTLIIAQNLLIMGDSMESMKAVLDSNFWLTTHVITVTLGYSATFVAGFVAAYFLVRRLFVPKNDNETARELTRIVYGIICFALLFSFIGTFTGGIWADQSWGRFWGWDPKENGALLIVIWNAVIIHSQHAYQPSTCRFMQITVAGNIVTGWSWFGTNMLGQGLHSYGFMDSAMLWLFAFWGINILLILLGFIPITGLGETHSGKKHHLSP